MTKTIEDIVTEIEELKNERRLLYFKSFNIPIEKDLKAIDIKIAELERSLHVLQN